MPWKNGTRYVCFIPLLSILNYGSKTTDRLIDNSLKDANDIKEVRKKNPPPTAGNKTERDVKF